MRPGDLVETTSQHSPRALGIVFKVEHDFYGKAKNLGYRMARIHILWQDGSMSADPETFVSVLSPGEWK